jgi:hypothetical protein
MVHELWFYMHWVGYLPFVHRTRLWYNNVILPRYERLLSVFPRLPLRENKETPDTRAQKGKMFEESIFQVSEAPISIQGGFEGLPNPESDSGQRKKLMHVLKRRSLPYVHPPLRIDCFKSKQRSLP